MKFPNTYRQENELLAMLIQEPTTLPDCRLLLNEEAFSDPENRRIWNAIVDADDAGTAISTGTILPHVNQQHFIDNILPLGNVGASYTEAHDKCFALIQQNIRRSAALIGMQAYDDAMGGKDIDTVLDGMRTLIAKIDERTSRRDSQRIDEALGELADIVSKRAEEKASGRTYRIPTSFPRLDRALYGGFAPGNLVILAARPSVGKTAVALQMAKEAAKKGVRTQYFSLEMTNTELAQRIAASTTLVRPDEMADGSVNWTLFEQAIGRFHDVPLWLNDQLVHIDDICAKISGETRRGNCDIAFIDYLGLMQQRDSKLSLYQQVTECTKRMKRMAKEAGIPIVLLCQLNRDAADELPQLQHLRDSGSIEQDADIVLMIHRNINADTEEEKARCTIFLRKNRQGITGADPCHMDFGCTKIYEVDERTEGASL